MTLTFGSYLSGMGMLDAGALEAGFAPVFGVEFDPGNPATSLAIAEMHERNIPGEYLLRRDICDVDPAGLDRVDWFHASPVCKEFSQAKKDGKETAADVAVANAIVRYVLHHKPRFVTIENVWQYRLSQSWNTIYQAIKHLYGIRVMKINMADYGVAQTRVRMIVLAQLGSPTPPRMRPTHTQNPPAQASLFDVSLPRWVGWYEAIADLVPVLPDSEFAPWQLARLPDELKTFAVSNSKTEWSDGRRDGGEPMLSVTAQHGGRLRAFLASSHSIDGGQPAVRGEGEPAVTVDTKYGRTRAFITSGENGGQEWGEKYRELTEPMYSVSASGKGVVRAFVIGGQYETPNNGTPRRVQNKTADEPLWTITSNEHGDTRARVAGGRVVKMTPRALARFQSLPDWYELSGNNTVDCTAIGNGVPSLFGRRLGEHIRRIAQ